MSASAGCGRVIIDKDPEPSGQPPLDAGGVALPGTCAPASPTYSGPLCGPPDRPCNVLADEIVIGTAKVRYASPGIVLDDQGAPHLVATENGAKQSNRGLYTRRLGPDAWSAPEETPFSVFALALTPGLSGTFFALINGGDGNTTLRALGPSGQWSAPAPIPGETHAAPGGLACDSEGIFHAMLGTNNYALQYGRYHDGWAVDSLDVSGTAPPPLALSPKGAPQTAYWDHSSTTDVKLYWQTFPGEPELVNTIAANNPPVTNAAIVLRVAPEDSEGPDGRPFILFSRPVNIDTIQKELVYATRDGAGAWRVSSPIDQEIHDYCGSDPAPLPGSVCTSQYAQAVLVSALLSRGGDVRFLYVKKSSQDVYQSSCANPPLPCKWVKQPESSTSKAELYIAWVDENNQVAKALLADSFHLSGGTAVLDASGTIHLAVYADHTDGDPAHASLNMVRYLQVGL